MSLSSIVKELTLLLQEANKKYDALKIKYKQMKTFWENTYNTLHEEHMNLTTSLLCQTCHKRLVEERLDGGCVELCLPCGKLLSGHHGRSVMIPEHELSQLMQF